MVPALYCDFVAYVIPQTQSFAATQALTSPLPAGEGALGSALPCLKRCLDYALAWLHNDVDQGQPAFVLDDTEGALQGRANGLRGDDGTFPIEAIGLGHLGEVDRWIVQPCANAGIGYGTLAHTGNVEGMLFRVIIRAVV